MYRLFAILVTAVLAAWVLGGCASRTGTDDLGAQLKASPIRPGAGRPSTRASPGDPSGPPAPALTKAPPKRSVSSPPIPPSPIPPSPIPPSMVLAPKATAEQDVAKREDAASDAAAEQTTRAKLGSAELAKDNSALPREGDAKTSGRIAPTNPSPPNAPDRSTRATSNRAAATNAADREDAGTDPRKRPPALPTSKESTADRLTATRTGPPAVSTPATPRGTAPDKDTPAQTGVPDLAPLAKAGPRPASEEQGRARPRSDKATAPGPASPQILEPWLRRLDAEIAIAIEHAGYIARHEDDIRWVHRHVRHLRHALDADSEPDGPGLGTGALQAAKVLGRRAGAGEDTFAERLALVGIGAGARLSAVMVVADNVLAETQANAQVRQWCEYILLSLRSVRRGYDANQNGHVEWTPDEAGTAQALRLIRPDQRKKPSS